MLCFHCGKEIEAYVLQPYWRHVGGKVECNNNTHSTVAIPEKEKED